jgi:hypothetical protein
METQLVSQTMLDVESQPPASTTFDIGFNTIKGGVYATEWTSSYISIYFFPRSQIPADIDHNNPDISTWVTPCAVPGQLQF